MNEYILSIIVGLIIVIMGILHIKGNISLLHSYHRKRVKKEDKLKFGRVVGTGTIIIGFTIIISGILSFLNYLKFSNIVLILGFVTGFLIIFYGLFKYNKGIF